MPQKYFFSVKNSLLLLSFLLFLGCYGGLNRTVIGDTSSPAKQQDPIEEANAALARGDYARAEVLGQKLVNNPNLSPEKSATVSQIYATAATRNHHPHVALTTLEQWRSLSSGVDTTKEWQDVWCEALNQLSSREARTISNNVYQDTGRSFAIRGTAGIFLAVRQWGDGELGQTMEALTGIYNAAPDNETRALLEGRLSLQLHGAPSQAVTLAASTVMGENRRHFPYNIIAIDFLRKQLLQSSDRSRAEEELAKLKTETVLADPSLFNGPPLPKQITYTPTQSHQIAGAQTIALALPLSGSYSAISAKIAEGAEVARSEMVASGSPINIRIIDTDSPDWVTQLTTSDAQTVGGVIRVADYAKVKKAGLLDKKVFFAFLPNLEGSDEGQKAWRFFTSPDDQIHALLDFSSKVGVTSFTALYPNEPYGQRMTQLFRQKTQDMGMSMAKTSGYTPNLPDNWRNITGELLAGNKNPSEGGFQAVFLPDGWKSSELTIANIFQFNESRLLLLGTSLWEQGLTGQVTLQTPQNYQLAVFPGNWNVAYPSSSGQRLQSALQQKGKNADFWSGLGYDYTRMAVSLDIVQGWTPASINTGLQSLSFGWSIAPLRWDTTGRASQDLFLFTPVDGVGFAPADVNTFRQKFVELWQQSL